MPTKQPIDVIGYAVGLGAADARTADAPALLRKRGVFAPLGDVYWQADSVMPPNSIADNYDLIAQASLTHAEKIKASVLAQRFFISVGGDHSSAIGTWSGACAGCSQPVGLIWIDAHMDSHTPESSDSGNIHGMPLAALLGQGDPRLTHLLTPAPKLLPQHVVVIGIRSYEVAEAALLKHLGVRVFDMNTVKQQGIDSVLQEAMAITCTGTTAYGISIDVDGLDPSDAPGTGTVVPDGIALDALCLA